MPAASKPITSGLLTPSPEAQQVQVEQTDAQDKDIVAKDVKSISHGRQV